MRYLIILLVFVFSACTDKTSIPSGILDKEKMEVVLWDMIIADRFASQFILKDSATMNVNDETFRLYSQVFEIHKVSREDFVKSYKFYLSRPDLGKVLFDSISVRASRLKEETYRPKDVAPADTLSK